MSGVTHVSRNCFRGSRPRDLMNLRIDFRIDTIIDLETGIYELFDGVLPQFPPDYGMSYYHMPCSDIVPPNDLFVAKAIDLMADMNRRTFIHCLSGVDRTGYVCALYRVIIDKWKTVDAIAEWKRLGRHPWYFWWEKSLRDYLYTLDLHND